MMKPLIAAIVCALIMAEAPCISAGCSLPASLPTADLCAVLEKSAAFDNKVVIVIGDYTQTPHAAILTNSRCSPSPPPLINLNFGTGFRQKDRTMKALWALTSKNQPAHVVLRGTFHVADKFHGFGDEFAPYQIDVSAIVCVEQYVEEKGK